MKKIIVVLIMLIATPAFAESWSYQEQKNEMGDINVKMAFVKDSDPDVAASFGVGYQEQLGKVVIFKILDKRLTSGKIDFKIDNESVFTLQGVVAREGLILAPASRTLIFRLKKGKHLKIRIDTREAVYTVDFTLDGSAEALDRLPKDFDAVN